jgi:hypothetical protein
MKWSDEGLNNAKEIIKIQVKVKRINNKDKKVP